MRFETCIDYSKNIIKWYKENGLSDADNLLTARMEETTFNDLSLRIGQKYLFCHQGSCKHFIRFTEVRIHNDIDKPNYNIYPIQTFQSKIRRRKWYF
jgi:snRNA-activating protein complex subunit 3